MNINELIVDADGKLTLPSGTSFPGSPSEGDVFYRSDEKKAYRYDGADWVQAIDSGDTTEIFDATSEPTGFPNRDDSEISFTDGTLTFTIQPKAPATEFDYYIKGVKYTKSSAQTYVITDTEGPWLFYFDGATLVGSQSTPSDLLSGKAFVAFIYWDATNNTAIILGEERHGVTMDWATHKYLHETVWTRYESGLTLTPLNSLPQTGSTLNDAQVNMTGGTIHDEDIEINIVHSNTPTNPFEQDLDGPAQIPVFYRSGANGDWRRETTDNYPLSQGASRMNYNQWTGATWQLTEGTNNYHIAIWIFATDNISEPIIAIVGQRQDNTLSLAEANNTLDSITWGSIPVKEIKPLYRIIAKTATSYSQPAALESILDYRSDTSIPGAGYISTSHNSLSGRSDANAHPASSINTDTANFNGLLSGTDVEVQTALETLDESFGARLEQADTAGQISTTSTTFINAQTITTASLPPGVYRVGWYYEWNHSSDTNDFLETQVTVGGTVYASHYAEPGDTSNWVPVSGFVYYTVGVAGTVTINLDYRVGGGSGTASVRRRRLEIWRVS